MKIEQNFSACFSCGACELRCPQKAIQLTMDESGFYYPKIDNNKCIKCEVCDNLCPALKEMHDETPLEFFYAINKDDTVRKKSSSGGVFHALAVSVLKQDGVVFGAAFNNKKLIVEHRSTEEVPLDVLLRSKYVESDAKSAYPAVKEFLLQNRKVLFCGTPCQVSGLYAFLGRRFENLITCDFVCHGVPPSLFLKQHLDFLGKKFRSKILSVNFRPKLYGWTFHCIKYVFENGRTYEEPALCDTFFRGFMTENIFLRESCYSCPFTKAHPSDITLADFWGVNALNPALNDNKGISLISINTDIGRALWKDCAGYFAFERIEPRFAEYAFKQRTPSPQKMAQRKAFLQLVQKKGFEKAAKKMYMRNTVKHKLKFLYKKLFNRGVHNV